MNINRNALKPSIERIKKLVYFDGVQWWWNKNWDNFEQKDKLSPQNVNCTCLFLLFCFCLLWLSVFLNNIILAVNLHIKMCVIILWKFKELVLIDTLHVYLCNTIKMLHKLERASKKLYQDVVKKLNKKFTQYHTRHKLSSFDFSHICWSWLLSLNTEHSLCPFKRCELATSISFNIHCITTLLLKTLLSIAVQTFACNSVSVLMKILSWMP